METQVVEVCIAAVSIVLLLLTVGLRRTPPRWIPSLRNKHVVITGGSKGIGLSLAIEALREGAFVTLISRSSEGLNKAVQNITEQVSYGSERICVKAADVGDRQDISAAIEECFEWRPIDVLICNAGITTEVRYLHEIDTKDLDLVIRTNLTGTVYTIRAALPLMKRRAAKECPASVVLMGSLGSMHPVYGQAIYGATKHAIKGIAECLRLELLPYDIRVTLPCPGFVRTQLVEDVERQSDEADIEIVKVVDLYDPNRLEDPAEVAKVTMRGVKEGSFLVTTKFTGLLTSTFSRGLFPAESFGRTITEMIVFASCRLVSYIFAARVRSTIRKYRQATSPISCQ